MATWNDEQIADSKGFLGISGSTYHVGLYVKPKDAGHTYIPQLRTIYMGTDLESAKRAIATAAARGVRIDCALLDQNGVCQTINVPKAFAECVASYTIRGEDRVP